MKIVYLSPDYIDDIKFKVEPERDEMILKHPQSLEYTPQGFVDAFNNEFISDLGLIAIKN